VTAVEVEVVCWDADEHRRRVETRVADIAGHKQPSWDDVLARDNETWGQADLVVDTAGSDLDDVVTRLVSQLPGD